MMNWGGEPARPLSWTAIAWFCCVVFTATGTTFGYAWGRAEESEFSLAAYQHALDAQAVARGYEAMAARLFGVSERAVRVCLMEDARLHGQMHAVGRGVE